jgi:hypothetical protein
LITTAIVVTMDQRRAARHPLLQSLLQRPDQSNKEEGEGHRLENDVGEISRPNDEKNDDQRAGDANDGAIHGSSSP